MLQTENDEVRQKLETTDRVNVELNDLLVAVIEQAQLAKDDLQKQLDELKSQTSEEHQQSHGPTAMEGIDIENVSDPVDTTIQEAIPVGPLQEP
ncbi:hypothetical protein GOP47_0018034 [Adiantum capillus-veneris]|uniref:Uncharacterized protein n=1 Tax=Adiantum capillus-veneris TaxID=13818 RepID=A0A9D4UGK2_ADICA|nr:hypothetical protein GOP47_0018034 [Adiantum capillus-veneris]